MKKPHVTTRTRLPILCSLDDGDDDNDDDKQAENHQNCHFFLLP